MQTKELEVSAVVADIGAILPEHYVSFVSESEKPAVLIKPNGRAILLTSGTKVGLGDLVKTNNSRVEVRDQFGMIVRLGERSEIGYFNEEVMGESLVFFGEVYKIRLHTNHKVYACGKYRTSCWMCPMSLYANIIDDSHDVVYALSEKVPIWEYDEKGEEFEIVTLNEGFKAVLRHDDDKSLRERYTVVKVSPVSDKEHDYISDNFLNPKRWRKAQ